jgi:hypothetical protein
MNLKELLERIRESKTIIKNKEPNYLGVQDFLSGIKETVEAVDNALEGIYPLGKFKELWQKIKKELE